VSDGLSELTEPMRQALRYHRGGWAVRGGDGVLRNGLTGRRIEQVAAALDLSPVENPDDLALAYLRPLRADHAQLMVSLSIRHPPGPVPLPGEPIEILTAYLTGRAPAAYGRFEPAIEPWDAAEIGWLCDRDYARGEQRSVFIVAGSPQAPASLVMAVQRGPDYTEERVDGLICLGRLGHLDVAQRLAGVDQAVATLTRTCDVTFALVSTRPGNRRLTQMPVMPNAPVPLNIFLGQDLVAGLGVDVAATRRRFKRATASPGRGLAIPLETGPASAARLPQLLRTLDFSRATPDMGISPIQLQAVEYAARY
jgi:hypothetical protein